MIHPVFRGILRFGGEYPQPQPNNPQKTVYYIGGPTSSGKTSLSVALAQRLPDAVFINADTMQLYRGLEPLAASPSDDELSRMNHRLFGVLNLNEGFSRGQWFDMARREIDRALTEGKTPILVGGSRSFLAELSEAAYGVHLPVDDIGEPTFPADAQSPRPFPYRLSSILLLPRNSTMAERLDRWVEGIGQYLELVRNVLAGQYNPEAPAFGTMAFQELKPVAEGWRSMDEALTLLKARVTRYAKEQLALYNRLFRALDAGSGRVLKIRTMDTQKRVRQTLEFMSHQDAG